MDWQMEIESLDNDLPRERRLSNDSDNIALRREQPASKQKKQVVEVVIPVKGKILDIDGLNISETRPDSIVSPCHDHVRSRETISSQ